jgi:branched-chain amino acid transport system substrate-binding protein
MTSRHGPPDQGALVRLAVCLILALGMSACGTRLPDDAFAPTSQVVSSGEAVSVSTPSSGGPDEAAVGAQGADGAAGGTGPSEAASGATGDPGAGGEGAAAPGAGAASGPNQASDIGVTADTIRIGNITAENGVLGDTFAPAVRGLRAWVQATNAAGGINGRKVELFTCDDREDRARSLECARRLVEGDQVFALIAANSRSLGGAAQYLADKKVPVLGFPISNSYFRYPNFFSVYGSGYARDGNTVGKGGQIVMPSGQYRWFKQHLGVSKAAVFNYDISESSQAGDSFVAGLRAEGFEVTQYTVSFAAPSFDQAVADMQQRGTEIIFDAMDDGANRRLCDSMARRSFKPKAKVSTVVVMGDSLGQNYNDTCREIVYVSVESLPYTSAQDEVKEFRSAYARYQPGLPLHQWALEGWFMGNVTAEALSAMGPAPTRAGFIDFLNTMPASTGSGIGVGMDFRPSSYDYDSPTVNDCFGIARYQQASGGWVLASDPFPFCFPDANNVATAAREQGN